MNMLDRSRVTAASNLWNRIFRRNGAYMFAVSFMALAASALIQPAMAMNIKEVTSPGGVKAWLVQENAVPLIAIKFAFRGGSAQDPDGKEGRANFLSSMLDEGAGDFDSQSFQERMEDIAMRLSFEDSRDHFYGNFQTLSENKDAAAELVHLAITKPRFDPDAIVRMRGQIQANLAYATRDPRRVASNAWFEVAFPGHAYGRKTDGTVESVGAIGPTDLENYRSSIFAKDNLMVVAVGDIDEAGLGKMLDKIFGELPDKAQLTAIPKTQPVTGGINQVIDMPVPQSVAVFGMGSLSRKDPDFMPAFVLNHIIGGGGFSSKLMEEVREKRGLAYSVYSYHNPFDNAAIYMGSVATKNESIAESLDVIREQLRLMAEQGPSQEDLDDAKRYLTGSYALRFDTNNKIASQLLGVLVEDMGIDYVEERNELIEAITIDDMKRAARRFLNIDDMIVTVVGKPVGLKGFDPHTKAHAASGKRG